MEKYVHKSPTRDPYTLSQNWTDMLTFKTTSMTGQGYQTTIIHIFAVPSSIQVTSYYITTLLESPSCCCSRCRSSLAVCSPTEFDLSLHLQCKLKWDLQWLVASVECPRSTLDGRHLLYRYDKKNVEPMQFHLHRPCGCLTLPLVCRVL